jgi:hypothetical protein
LLEIADGAKTAGIEHKDLADLQVIHATIGSQLGAMARGLDPFVAEVWHNYGMPRIRVSTTVDEELLQSARRVRQGTPDSMLLDEAFVALLSIHRAAEADASYAAYDEHPLSEVDEWGDLASFREAAAAS